MWKYSFILLLVGCGVNKQLVKTIVPPLPSDTIYTETIDTIFVVDIRYIKDTIKNTDTVIITETKFQNRQIIKTVFEDRYRNIYIADSIRHQIQQELNDKEKAKLNDTIKELKQKTTDVRRNNIYLWFIIILLSLLFIVKFKWLKLRP